MRIARDVATKCFIINLRHAEIWVKKLTDSQCSLYWQKAFDAEDLNSHGKTKKKKKNTTKPVVNINKSKLVNKILQVFLQLKLASN